MEYSELKIPKCKKFSGYKPCIPYENCLENGCVDGKEQNRTGTKIIIISLDAMGNVLDNTPILPAIKRKFPESTIYWITMSNAVNILANSEFIDKVFPWNDESRMILKNIKFDYLFNADKSAYACAFANEINANNKLGFLLNEDGKIYPANPGAFYSYMMGIDDKLKFRINRKTGVEIIHEVFELEYRNDEYQFNFDEKEKEFIKDYRKKIEFDNKSGYIGFNTGCSELFPNKKMTVSQHIEIINSLLKYDNIKIVLLGGREDTERNNLIYKSFSEQSRGRIINTPTDEGIRRGACYMMIPDVVITGDTFGLHLAIALKKFVIVWFGLSCASEIELYGRGEKLISEGLECSPCWKRECPYNLECISRIDLKKMKDIALNYINEKK